VEDYSLKAYSPRVRARIRPQEQVIIAALDTEDTYNGIPKELEELMTPEDQANLGLWVKYDSDDPRHPDAWQKGIFPS
jgi:hypothetical protein